MRLLRSAWFWFVPLLCLGRTKPYFCHVRELLTAVLPRPSPAVERGVSGLTGGALMSLRPSCVSAKRDQTEVMRLRGLGSSVALLPQPGGHQLAQVCTDEDTHPHRFVSRGKQPQSFLEIIFEISVSFWRTILILTFASNGIHKWDWGGGILTAITTVWLSDNQFISRGRWLSGPGLGQALFCLQRLWGKVQIWASEL